jgi:hypothetical protein
VLEIYERDHGQGWGVIAKRLGIKPGSAEFHALKGDMGKSHAKRQGGGKSGNSGYQGDDRAPHGGPGKAKPGNGAGKGKDDDKGRGKGKHNGPPHG